MGFLDDLQVRIGQAGTMVRDKINEDINSYYKNHLVNDVVKIGQAATGNLSQAEIDAGKRAVSEPIPPAQPLTASVSPVLVFAIVGLGAFLLLSKKARRG